MSRITISHAEFLAEAERRFGPNPGNWKVVCPACGTVQTPYDLVKAGLTKEEAARAIGFNCVGRYTGKGDEGIAAKNKNQPWDKGCNWSLGGLLHIHELEVVMDDGHKRPAFQLAPA